jgi:transposase-like protein
MSKAQLVITAVVLEGRSKSEVARDYDVSRQWVQQLCKRYEADGDAAYVARSRRPHHSPQAVTVEVEERIVRLRKTLTKRGLDAGADTIAAHLATDPTITNVPAVSTIWGLDKPRSRFFLRAESFYNVATETEALGPEQLAVFGGVSPHARSHGESFLDLMRHRFFPDGAVCDGRTGGRSVAAGMHGRAGADG